MSTNTAFSQDTIPRTSPEPPRWVWLWFPLLLFCVLLLLAVRDDSDPAYTHRWWASYLNAHSEFCFVELATPVASALAVIAGIAALRTSLPWLRVWVALVTLGCVYITGEELWWGQYIFGWNAPEGYPSVETNLHSISEAADDDGELYYWATWFNEKPRLLLELFVLYGGIIHVLAVRPAPSGGAFRAKDWFWPTYVCLPCALLTILARMPDRLDWLGFGYAPLLFDSNLVNWQSLQELFFSLFLFVYLLSIWYRLGREGGESGGGRP